MPVEEGELTSDTSMATFTNYLWTIVYMPMSLRVLCLTNLFCWMSLVCYSLYFTDFVGEAVFKGDPSVRPYFNRVIQTLADLFHYYFRLLQALKNDGCMTKAYSSVVGEWRCIRYRAPCIPLLLRN